jgi:hypothetical protein
VFAAVEQADVVVGVNRHARHLVELVALGELAPALVKLVDIVCGPKPDALAPVSKIAGVANSRAHRGPLQA